MIEFQVKSKTLPLGKRKGQTVYFGQPVSQQHLTNKMVVDRIVRETSLSVGDVSNVLISLGVIVCDALELGQRIDLADLGSLCIIVSPVMMNSEEEVTVEKALKTPKIVFTPKSSMRSAANSVELHIVKKRKTISRKVRRKEKVQDLLLYQRIRK
ncbi:MAG: DNA-binding protein [Solobacterium sp.]|mgnify:FL=1|jgi:putative DNA-binding protein|nr:DNA-binding protein [Solobacterium sp.]